MIATYVYCQRFNRQWVGVARVTLKDPSSIARAERFFRENWCFNGRTFLYDQVSKQKNFGGLLPGCVEHGVRP